MCGLFGFSCYGDEPIKNLSVLTNSLAEHSAVRGTDAAGIAFCSKGIQVQKEAKSAYTLTFKHPDTIPALIGHTRHATHGDAKKNYNNHPFVGKLGKSRFALAHNGVLGNVVSLRLQYDIPSTKIETDSYIAVQLIEKQKELTFDSLRYMAEAVTGSFSFSLLDDRNTLWLVKGDSPLSILHFPEKHIYIYASTEEILYKAIIESPLFTELKKGHFEEVPIGEGTIMKISPNGRTESESFVYDDYDYFGRCWWEYGCYAGNRITEADREYLDFLRTMAGCQGIEPEEVDALLEEGFSPEEVEEYLYEI